MQQGRCTLPTEPGRDVLDRLAGLYQVISPAQVRQALHATGRVNPRACRLTHEVVLWIVVAMGLLTDLPIRQVFKACRRWQVDEPTPCRSALCAARRRLGPAPARALHQQVVRPLATAATPGAFYQGLRLVGIDGTLWDLPDSPSNARVFGRPTGGRGAGAFPQLRKLSLVELGTHAELALVLKPCWRGEPSMVAGLRRHLQPGMLLLWDRGFFSYALWQLLCGRGVQILARVKRNLILQPTRTLADGSYLAKIYPSAQDRAQDRHGIVVRVIRYTLTDPHRAGAGEEHVLITTLLDAAAHPAVTLILLYHERWEHELVYDEQKTHQDPRRATKPAQLRSETPAGVVQEVYALALGHFVTRALMVEAARPLALDVDRLSFLGCLQILRCRLPECDSRSPATLAAWFAGLRAEMGQELIEARRNRVNPRVVKRRLSKFWRKKPAQRPVAPLKKRFSETIVMLN